MPKTRRNFQKILIIIWLAAIFVLAQAYSGNLTAMLTAPGLPTPIRNSEEFLAQKELSLIIPKNSGVEYFFKHFPSDDRARLGQRASVSREPTLAWQNTSNMDVSPLNSIIMGKLPAYVQMLPSGASYHMTSAKQGGVTSTGQMTNS